MKGKMQRKLPGLEEKETLRDDIDEMEDISPNKRKWKWILFGSAGFVFVFLMSLFFAAMYVHKKEATLKLHKTKSIVYKPVVKQEKKHVIKRYELSPFFLRLKNPETGRDNFISAQLYIEFVRKELPGEIKAKRELLRTLIYRQLKKHFTTAENTPAVEKEFKKEMVPTLNIFFKGGGVYAIGFKELLIR